MMAAPLAEGHDKREKIAEMEGNIVVLDESCDMLKNGLCIKNERVTGEVCHENAVKAELDSSKDELSKALMKLANLQ